MRLSIIAAVSENNVIGRDGDLPWRLRGDLRRFRTLTTGQTVIAGRKTHESIVRSLGGPLPNRHTIVLSRDPQYRAAGCDVRHTWEDALERAQGEEDVYVIGGADIYALALPRADRLLLTRVHAQILGNTVFPPFERDAWRVISQEHHPVDAQNEFPHTFEVLTRK